MYRWRKYAGGQSWPDQTGVIRDNEANAVIALNQERLKIRKGAPLPRNGEFISLGCPATASSVYEGNEQVLGAAMAVDGGMQTRWAAADTLAELKMKLDETKPFNKLSIFEYCDVKRSSDGFSNQRFNRIEAYQIDIWRGDQWATVYISDEQMGDCKVIRFPQPYRTSELRLKVLKALAPPSIYELNVINLPR